MSSSAPTPPNADRNNLGTWLLRLGPGAVPIDARVRDAALEELAGQDTGTAALAQRLLADPAQVLLLFRAANRALARYDRTVYTLEHAISLLGNQRVRQLLAEAPVLPADHPHAADFRQALLRSVHAASQARMWAEGSGRWQPDEVFWSTLLATAPLWPLWLEEHSPLRRLEQLRVHQGAVSTAQEEQYLGCRLADLCAALGEYWLLPENSRFRWHTATAGSARQWLALARAARLDEPPVLTGQGLRELGHHPALVIALANVLALESDWDWYSERCDRLLRIAASSCRRPLATLVSHCHRIAAELSQDWAESGLLTPGARLLGYWNESHFRAPPPKPAFAAPSRANAAQLAAIRRLRQPGAIENTWAAFSLLVQTLRDGAGFARAACFLRGPDGELSGGPSVGFEPARPFHHKPEPASLLGRLLAKPQYLHVHADNHARFQPHLPAALRGAIRGENFLLMSVFANQRPQALILAENGSPNGESRARQGQAADDHQQRLFKQLCRELSLCLERIGTR